MTSVVTAIHWCLTFSMTIDSATRQTLKTSIPGLGDFGSPASWYEAMRCYIALSRVKSASCVLVAKPFNPLLFRQGPQPFPSLLFDTMMGKVSEKDLKLRCEKAEKESKQTTLLADALWALRRMSTRRNLEKILCTSSSRKRLLVRSVQSLHSGHWLFKTMCFLSQ